MAKVEIPTSVTLYVQWVLHPFENPQVPEQKSANSKWALARANELLEANYIDTDDVKVAVQLNGMLRLEIIKPDLKSLSGKEFWMIVFNLLKESNNIESISVFVNNDTSDKIAMNLADRVSRPWHQGYQGYDTTTLIYHK